MRTRKEFIDAIKNGVGLNSLSTIITNDFIKHKNIELAEKQHKWLKGKSKDFELLYFQNLILLNFYEESLIELNNVLLKGRIFISDRLVINSLIKLGVLLNRNVIQGFHIRKLSLGWFKPITKLGENNIDELLKVLDIILLKEYTNGFLNQFYIVNENGKIQSTYEKKYYHKYYKLGKQAEKELNTINNNLYKNANGKATKNEVENAIGSACSNLMRMAENNLRISMGGKYIGEGYISETELFYKIKKQFSNLNVIQHGRPNFLGMQHFDVWIPEINIAIEYQGAQHDRPVDFFGGEDAFKKNQERDKLKRQKCIKNNVSLFEVRPDYDFNELVKQIENIIKKRFANN
jgi:predicted transcriptional regulator